MPPAIGPGIVSCFFAWQGVNEERLVVAVNYAPNQSQCYIRLAFSQLRDRQWRFEDLLNDMHYDRNGNDLESRGLYLDMAPWEYHVFKLQEPM